MNIIIAGAGKVGFNLAKKLSIAHNVTIIDINSEALHRIQENIDIMAIHGDVEDIKTYKEIKNRDIDLFIAVTNIDNTNLVSSLVADNILKIDKKIVRLKRESFNNQNIKDSFKIDKFIFPIELASKTVSSLLMSPKANNIKYFQYTDYELISVMVSNDFKPTVLNQSAFKIIGIEREKEFFIPNLENIEILPNDLVYFFGLEEDTKIIYEQLDMKSSLNIHNCVVVGGNNLGIAIANILADAKCSVKLLEKDIALCEEADERLNGRVNIINTKYNSHDLFKSEALDQADIFIATTADDEFNIIQSLEAKDKGIKKVVAINNDIEYYGLMHSLGIIAIRGPKISAYNKIMEEINSSKIVVQKNFCGSKASICIRKVFKNSELIGKNLKPINSKNSRLFYIRDEILYIFKKDIILQNGDLIVLFSTKNDNKEKNWLHEL